MTSTALTLVQTIFSETWRLFNSWYIPGTNVTPAAWFIFLVVGALTIRFIVSWLSTSHAFGMPLSLRPEKPDRSVSSVADLTARQYRSLHYIHWDD